MATNGDKTWDADWSVTIPSDFEGGEGFECGFGTIIGDNVTVGKNVKIGSFCVIEAGCILSDNVALSHYVRLGPNTILHDGVWMDSYTLTSGQCIVGMRTQVRYQSIIARNVVIGSDVFLCAGVKTAYLNHAGNPSKVPMTIGSKVFIGDNSTILAGLIIKHGAVIGAHTLVTKNCAKENGIYVGCPANFTRSLSTVEKKARQKRIEEIKKKWGHI